MKCALKGDQKLNATGEMWVHEEDEHGLGRDACHHLLKNGEQVVGIVLPTTTDEQCLFIFRCQFRSLKLHTGF